MLLLKYVDDNIDEAEIIRSSFVGVRIPIFMLKDSDASYIYDVLNSESEFSQLSIKLRHFNEIDKSENRIQIYMNAYQLNNPIVTFLKDL